MLDITKPMATRSGIRVAYCHAIPKEFNCIEPLVAVLEGDVGTYLYRENGCYWFDTDDDALDLINIEE